MAVYATVPLLLHGEPVFEPGDELQRHYTPEALEKLIAWGHASHKRPADVTPAYALIDDLMHHPHNFRRGDRIDGIVPRAQVRAIVERGDAAWERPREVTPVFALVELSHRPHGARVDFAPGERVDGRVPTGVLADWIKSGHVTYDEPGAAKPSKA